MTLCKIIIRLDRVTTIRCQEQVSKIPRDQKIGSLDPVAIIVTNEACVHWVYSIWNTQSWEGTEYEAEEADRHVVLKAGKSAAV